MSINQSISETMKGLFGEARSVRPYKRRVKSLKTRSEDLPESIAGEYEDGTPVLTIAAKYNSTFDQVRRRLVQIGVTIKPRGIYLGTRNKTRKITDDILKQVIEWDNQGIPHMQIERLLLKKYHISVTRERVRQVCLAAGQPTRRSRIIPQIDSVMVKKAVRMAENKRILEETARMWKEGLTCAEICEALRGRRNYTEGASMVSSFRKKNPELFPYRRIVKKSTPEIQKERFKKMITLWNQGKTLKELSVEVGISVGYLNVLITNTRKTEEGLKLFPRRIGGRKSKQ